MNKNLCQKQNYQSKEKGIVLPTVVISMVIISLFSALILSFIISSNLSSNLLFKFSQTKLDYEQIYFKFKQGEDVASSNQNVFTYSVLSQEQDSTDADENVKAIIIKNKEKFFMFAIFETTPSGKQDLIYQTSNISIELFEDNSFDYFGYHFICDQNIS